MISLKINGQNLEVEEGSTVLQAATAVGVIIPTLCYHKDLSPFGGCRLCVVKIQGARLPMTACNLPVSPGLVIETDTQEIIRYRRSILRMLLSRYYDAAYKPTNGHFDLEQESELAHWARVYDVDIRAAMSKKPFYPVDSDPNPFVWVDMNKCIQCTRCVRACAEIQGRFVWSQSFRGYKAQIVAGADSTMLASRCESCGACVVYCPTGALDHKMSVHAGRADRKVRTVCTYCGVGCVLDLNVRDDVPGGRVIRVTSNSDRGASSVNGLHLCVKGRYGYDFIHHTRRETRPRVRQYLLDGTPRPKGRGKWVDVDWDTALNLAATGLRQARDQFGAQKMAVLASGKCLNEENYLLNKFARQVLGTPHIDCCANIYIAGVVDGLMESLGIPAMSNSLDDIVAEARSLFVIGSNLTEQHPVFGAQIRQAVLRRRVKMVVANPDFYNIDEYATLSLRHRPHTETALINGLMYIILQRGWQGQASIARYPQGFDKVKTIIESYTPQRVAEITGLEPQALYQTAEILANNHPTAIIWSVGLADRKAGKQTVYALANLQLLLGNLDQPGGEVNPLRSQNNIQGAYDMGCIPGMLPGYQALADSIARAKFEQAWGGALPAQAGLSAPEMISAATQGRIKAMYIVGEDIINTSSQASHVRQSLDSLEFLVLQEAIASDTARYADVLLPGVSFAEKSGTFTSTERRIQQVRQAIQPVGEARPDWQIIIDLAQHILKASESLVKKAPFAAWNYEGTDQILDEIIALTPIYAGVSHAALAHNRRIQWPVEKVGSEGASLLPLGTFSEGKICWMPAEQISLEEEIYNPTQPS